MIIGGHGNYIGNNSDTGIQDRRQVLTHPQDFGAFFQNNDFGRCNFKMYIHTTPCQLRKAREGVCTFNESMTFFADYDLGEGATCEMVIDWGLDQRPKESILVKIHWLDWNSFEYKELMF